MALAGIFTSGIIFYRIEQSRTRLHIILLLYIAVSNYTEYSMRPCSVLTEYDSAQYGSRLRRVKEKFDFVPPESGPT